TIPSSMTRTAATCASGWAPRQLTMVTTGHSPLVSRWTWTARRESSVRRSTSDRMNSSKRPPPGVGLATAEAAIASAEDEAALGAYTFAVLPPDDPRRDAARPAYLAALVRHHAIRAEVAALVAAWRHEGVA